MRKYIFYILCLTGMYSLNSCNDLLDAAPQDQISNDKFWKSEKDAEKLIIDLYSATLPSGIFWDECMSDNAYLAYDWWGGQLSHSPRSSLARSSRAT